MAVSLEDFLFEERPFQLPGGSADIAAVRRDSRFVLLERQDSTSPLVATWSACLEALVFASFRASRLPGQIIPARDIPYWMGWSEVKLSNFALKTLLYWGRPFGLLSPAAENNALSLPLSSLIHDVASNMLHPEAFKSEFHTICRSALSVVNSKEFSNSWDLCDYLQTGLVTSDKRTLQVLYWRIGIRGSPKTLEQIGKKLGVTRERVRQIEARIKRIAIKHRPLCLKALALDFFTSRGVRVIRSGNSRKGGWALLASLLELDTAESGKPALSLLGVNPNTLTELDWQGWNHRELFGGAALRVITEWKPGLCWEDVKTLRDHFAQSRLQKMNITERVYVALEHLGRPAHYSEIGAVCRQLFGDSKLSDRSIHAAVGRMPEVAYVGRKGTYGLIKDGAVRPLDDLYSLVPDVLHRRFGLMGVALPFEVILGEVRKERPGADENSVKMILSFKAVRDTNGRWMPHGADQDPIIASSMMPSRFAKRVPK